MDGSNVTTDTATSVQGEELRQFVERIERLEQEKKNIADSIKETYAELKGRGYLMTPIRKIVAMRKRSKDDLDEEEAMIEVYKNALGMS